MENAKECIKQLISKSNYSFEDLLSLVAVLRSKDGCPWDREQTGKSIRNCFIDETYEFIEGLDNNDNELMCEELGDVLFQVVFHADIKKDEKHFSMDEVIDGICKKMILRHPHVFGSVNVENSAEVLVNWENIKNDEKSRKTPYEQLDSVAKSLPSLMRAQKLVKKAWKTGLEEQMQTQDIVNNINACANNLKNDLSGENIGQLLMHISRLCQRLELEGEQLLYIENDKYLKKYR